MDGKLMLHDKIIADVFVSSANIAIQRDSIVRPSGTLKIFDLRLWGFVALRDNNFRCTLIANTEDGDTLIFTGVKIDIDAKKINTKLLENPNFDFTFDDFVAIV